MRRVARGQRIWKWYGYFVAWGFPVYYSYLPFVSGQSDKRRWTNERCRHRQMPYRTLVSHGTREMEIQGPGRGTLVYGPSGCCCGCILGALCGQVIVILSRLRGDGNLLVASFFIAPLLWQQMDVRPLGCRLSIYI